MEHDSLEGRLLAHRRMLQLIVSALAHTPAGERLDELLRERTTMQDGQEDPGAVATDGMGVELALAEEFRRTVEGIPPSIAPRTGSPPRSEDAGAPSVPGSSTSSTGS
jgi:hypothetical protein